MQATGISAPAPVNLRCAALGRDGCQFHASVPSSRGGTEKAKALNPVVLVWLQFLLCALVIGVAGVKLSRYGDVIAEKTGVSRTWVGLILLATVTSLPELVTGVTAVTAAAVPNIAIGDVLGSCVFNLLLVVMLDFLHRGESVFTRATQGHILSAGFGTLLTVYLFNAYVLFLHVE